MRRELERSVFVTYANKGARFLSCALARCFLLGKSHRVKENRLVCTVLDRFSSVRDANKNDIDLFCSFQL